MIFTFNESIKYGDAGTLARTIFIMSQKHHHILYNAEIARWLSETILGSTKYLGGLQIDSLKNNRELWCITRAQEKYQKHITVGFNDGDLTIAQLEVLIREPSYVILENSVHDWAAICKWIELYKNEKLFKNLNESVYWAIKENQLRPYNAGGGNGTIANVFRSIERLYHGKAKYKITTIYDSDKTSLNDCCNHNRKLNQFLEESGFIGHELHKREIENYFPIETYRKAGMIKDTESIPDYTPEEYDFVDIEKATFTNYKKNKLKELSSFLDKQSLKNRIAHHKHSDSVDEIQKIIINLYLFI